MLQRIQTIFLFIIVLSLFVFHFFPIWDKIDKTSLHTYTICAWKFQDLDGINNVTHTYRMPYMLLGILAIIISCISIYSIIRFDNRVVQLKLGSINSLLLTVLLGTIIYLVAKAQSSLMTEISGKYRLGFIMPIIAVISNLLSNYFIRKDEELVKSTNRIR